MLVTGAVEGPSDEAVLRKILEHVDVELGQVYGLDGKNTLSRNLSGYNNAAHHSPWVVLMDLDRDSCVVSTKAEILPNPARLMCLRIAVRELESWLLADRERFSSYFTISLHSVPLDPDALPNPKQALINLARKSKKKAVREDIVPNEQLGQSIGPAYTSSMIEFVRSPEGWRVEEAIKSSRSLQHCVLAIQRLEVTPL